MGVGAKHVLHYMRFIGDGRTCFARHGIAGASDAVDAVDAGRSMCMLPSLLGGDRRTCFAPTVIIVCIAHHGIVDVVDASDDATII